MIDYKQLCVELLAALENEGYTHWTHAPDEDELCLRTRAALAEPEPEGPTDEEIMDLMPQQMRDDLAAAARVMSSFHPDINKTDSVFRMILNCHSVDHARAVLARWGK